MRATIDQWGKDHWSTLAYIETCCVDNDGKLVNARMRTSHQRHPLLAHRSKFGGGVDGHQYPTMLRGEATLEGHDDWDCLRDLEEAGLVKIKRPTDRAIWDIDEGRRGPIKTASGFHHKEIQVRVGLTNLGLSVTAELRAYKTKGGNFGSFSPSFASAVAVPA
jgi:hypothetical protein